MSIYIKKQQWKLGLLVLALLIGFSSLWVTNNLVRSLAAEERKNMELWAEATREIINMDHEMADLTFLWKVIRNNETVPVIVIDDYGKILDHRNLNNNRTGNPGYLRRQLALMESKNEPIEIDLGDNIRQYIYYKDSRILVWLAYYPYIQLLVIVLFLLVTYYAFSVSRKAEQNQVWLGMSKETAHQLGTPTSSLLAWLELMKERNYDNSMLEHLESDIKRLEKITARFSRIGSRPVLQNENLFDALDRSIDYLRARSPGMVIFEKNYTTPGPIIIPVNIPLFEWVIENVCKNALDAMESEGKISFSLKDQERTICLDVSDSGRGIPRNRFKTVFKPGYTTRRNGWGLGLSLSRRIIEEYHNGKIFVLQSTPKTGTTIRIILNKYIS